MSSAWSSSEGMSHKQIVERVLNDPEIHARVEADLQKKPEHVEGQRLYAEAAAGLLEDLEGLVPDLDELGVTLTHISDLWSRAVFVRDSEGNEISRRKIDYRAAIPVLLEWLPKVRYFPLADSIVRALMADYAKREARPVLFRLFRDVPPVGDPRDPDRDPRKREILRTTIGTALGKFSDPSVADEAIELALDRSYGEARTRLVNPGLAKTKDPRVPDVLLSLLDDPTVAPQAIKGLARVRHTPAIPDLESALDSPDKNVRDQARQALKKLRR